MKLARQPGPQPGRAANDRPQVGGCGQTIQGDLAHGVGHVQEASET